MSDAKQDQHALITAVRELAIELGRTPTRQEFINRIRGGRYKLAKHFEDQYSALIQASGLEPTANSRVRITNEVFRKDIDRHLEAYKPTPQKSEESYQRTLFIPDTHFPFGHQRTLEAIYRFAEKEKPEVIVQVGDLFDNFSHSKFPRSPNEFTPRDEQRAARIMAETMWRELQTAAPEAKCYQLKGNHDDRGYKRILEAFPAGEDWIERMVTEVMTFNGVTTIYDQREELKLPGDVAVVHGFKSQLGQHRDAFLHNVVTGHLHVGGVSYRQIHGRVLWEMNAGLAGDPQSKGLSYTPSKITNWTLGWAWLDEYGPRFIPLRGVA